MKGAAGRWGANDEIGARNLVDRGATLRGAAAIRSGKVIPLAIEIVGGQRGPVPEMRPPVQHFMMRDGGDYAAGLAEKHGFGFTDDIIMLPTHGTTHVDALSHVVREGQIYNGFSANTITSRGARHCGIDKLEPIVTRGIFLDFADAGRSGIDHAITRDELAEAVAQTGVDPLPGDALLVRTGWLAAWREGRAEPMRSSGLHHDCGEWIVEKGFALVGADNVAVEVLPSRDKDNAAPLHITLIRENGVYLAELLDLEALVDASQPDFQLIIAPLRIRGGVGSPVTPVAVL